MEAVASAGVKAGPKLGANQSIISGRITNLSTFEIKGKRMHEAVITTPAPDAYSMPGVVAVQSSYKLGNVGEDVQVHVSVTGIPNSWTDRNTGEVKNSANVRLAAVE